MTDKQEIKARKRVIQTLGWLYVMDKECNSRKEWRIKLYYLLLYVAGLIPESMIQSKVLNKIAL